MTMYLCCCCCCREVMPGVYRITFGITPVKTRLAGQELAAANARVALQRERPVGGDAGRRRLRWLVASLRRGEG